MKGKFAAERFVATGRGPESVIQMRQADDREPAMFGEIDQEACQRDGIGPAGQTDEDPATGWQETVPADRAADLLVDTCQSQIPNPKPQGKSQRLGFGFWALGFDLPEGRLELPTPRL